MSTSTLTGRHILAPGTASSHFGDYYDLSPFAQPGALPSRRVSSFIVSSGRPSDGFRPCRIVLPHQLYVKDVPEGHDVWVLPVTTPWLQVVGKQPGILHPEVEA